MPSPVITLGAAGFGESYGSTTCTVTLTADVPKSDSTTKRGLYIVVATKESQSDPTPPVVTRPVVTDNSPLTGYPYCQIPNYVDGSVYWEGANTYPPHGQRDPVYWPYRSVLRGALSYVVVTDLSAGDELTIDLSALGFNPVWMGCQVHLAENLAVYSSAVFGSNGAFTDSFTWDTVTTGNPVWSGTMFTFVPSPWVNQLEVDDLNAQPDIGIHYTLQASSSPDCVLMYSVYDIDAQYPSGTPLPSTFAVHGTPIAFSTTGPGWRDPGEGANTYFFHVAMSDVTGALTGIPYVRCFIPQIYRRP